MNHLVTLWKSLVEIPRHFHDGPQLHNLYYSSMYLVRSTLLSLENPPIGCGGGDIRLEINI